MKNQIFILFIIFNISIFSQEGVLDPTFGNNGIVSIGFGSIFSNDIATCMDIQSDGKIVVAGYSGNKIALARFNTDGTLDNTFGIGGKVTTEVYPGGSRVEDIKIQNDGKIVVAGTTYSAAPAYLSHIAVLRYNPDGTLDNSFNNYGKFVYNLSTTFNQAYSLTIQIDGKILVAGTTLYNDYYSMIVLRIQTNGTMDDTFGTGGKVVVQFPNNTAYCYSVAIKFISIFSQKIVLAGSVENGYTNGYDFAVVQLNFNGSYDNSFGTGGIVKTTISQDNDQINDCIVLPDHKILVVGYSNYSKIGLARYNTDGSLDNTFSGDGMQITSFADYCNAEDFLIQNDNKIITIGGFNIQNQRDILLTRFNSTGVVDNSFGSNGFLMTSVGDTTDRATSAKFQSDGKLVVAGYSLDGLGYGNFVVLRYIITSKLVGVEDKNEMPTEFRLEQNFPNPFNPTTKIKFSMPEVESEIAQTVLKVYDVLGNEVATLVDEYKPAGNYEVEFNASKLSSGTYFYRLTAGEFSETKKLILIK